MKQDSLRAARQLQQEVEKKKWVERKLKKDAVLHLRVEANIMDQIKAEAAAGGMSVSDLVRCYLVERFSEPRVSDDAPEFLLATTAFADAITMRDTFCAVCGEALPRSANARLACGPPPPPRLVCCNCYDGLQSQLEQQQQELSQGDE